MSIVATWSYPSCQMADWNVVMVDNLSGVSVVCLCSLVSVCRGAKCSRQSTSSVPGKAFAKDCRALSLTAWSWQTRMTFRMLMPPVSASDSSRSSWYMICLVGRVKYPMRPHMMRLIRRISPGGIRVTFRWFDICVCLIWVLFLAGAHVSGSFSGSGSTSKSRGIMFQ